MSALTDHDTDNMTIEHLDFDYEEPCEYNPREPCDHAAEWKVITNCCGKIFLFCDEHFWNVVNKINMQPLVNIICPIDRGCGAQFIGIAHAERI